ncbi:cAMP responsive element binding protein 3-like [Cichlidogyrus casuarinus]|uniref:cAMP responsive element binding protein 3-like n=1 Tax=Cichlidogyrus casuarinus TaxID=1844966 RepID=A0ABD2QIE0_9PLAT
MLAAMAVVNLKDLQMDPELSLSDLDSIKRDELIFPQESDWIEGFPTDIPDLPQNDDLSLLLTDIMAEDEQIFDGQALSLEDYSPVEAEASRPAVKPQSLSPSNSSQSSDSGLCHSEMSETSPNVPSQTNIIIKTPVGRTVGQPIVSNRIPYFIPAAIYPPHRPQTIRRGDPQKSARSYHKEAFKQEQIESNVYNNRRMEKQLSCKRPFTLTPPGSISSSSDNETTLARRHLPSKRVNFHNTRGVRAAINYDSDEESNLSYGRRSYSGKSQAHFQSPIPQSGVLMLTDEEKRTLLSEGYSVPTRLPLTKQEERNLKKIRRKIKNKISAQESRRKKKEYLESLEKRVDGYSQENGDLKRRMESLESTNRSLLGQVRHLQQLLNKSHQSQGKKPVVSPSRTYSLGGSVGGTSLARKTALATAAMTARGQSAHG